MAGKVRRVVLIQGHPDRSGGHFCHALADAYLAGARESGHHVDVIELAAMDMPWLRSRSELSLAPPDGVALAQAAMLACDCIVVIHPIWNGGAPALVRAFMEHAFRPSFTFPEADPRQSLSFMSAFRERKALTGKTARVITTMQMPAMVYRLLFRPHQEANALWLAGVRPVRETPIGGVESKDGAARRQWLARVRAFGTVAR